jgi:hypothetical protein
MDLESYKISDEGGSNLSEEVENLTVLLEESTEKNKQIGEKVSEIPFSTLDDNPVSSLEEEVEEAVEKTEELENKKQEIDDEIDDRARDINDEVKEKASDARELVNDKNRGIFGSVRDQSTREAALSWYEELKESVEIIEDISADVRGQIPKTIEELHQKEEDYEEFLNEFEALERMKNRLASIEEGYYQESQDEMPEGLYEEMKDRRKEHDGGKVTEYIKELISRIEEISNGLTIDIPPLRDRVEELINKQSTISVDEVATQVPRDEANETPQEVISVLDNMIQNREAKLNYAGGTIVQLR